LSSSSSESSSSSSSSVAFCKTTFNKYESVRIIDFHYL
jgi:hypothetical protein